MSKKPFTNSLVLSINKKSHKDNRTLVCLTCFSKGSGMTEAKQGSLTLNRIYKFFLKSFDLSNEHFPNAIYFKCRKGFERLEIGDKNIILTKPFDFSKRNQAGKSKCIINWTNKNM